MPVRGRRGRNDADDEFIPDPAQVSRALAGAPSTGSLHLTYQGLLRVPLASFLARERADNEKKVVSPQAVAAAAGCRCGSRASPASRSLVRLSAFFRRPWQEVFKLKSLQRLDLGFNEISNLGSGIGKLRRLEQLSMS